MIEQIGKYKVLHEIGKGGMGSVYLGHDPYNERPVAIKLAYEDPSQDISYRAKFQRMFFNEARIAGMLKHPNILPIYDAGSEGSHFYIVMEYIKSGLTLKEYCRTDNLLPISSVSEIIYKCCKALEYAHNLGVIHRDIKPTNIMLTENLDVKIADFGIAQIIRGEATQFAELMGTPLYMSPEQVNEQRLTENTDIYSLGVVLYELLTGKSPFDADTFASVVRKILYYEPPPLRFYRSDIPKEMDAIVRRAIAKKNTERYHKCSELIQDISLIFTELKHSQDEFKRQERFRFLRDLSFFRDFSDTELWEIFHAGIWKEFSTGKNIITEGTFDDTFYVIVSGEVIVLKGDRFLTSLKQGDCFGEMGFIARGKRTATVVSSSDLVLLEIASNLLDQLSPQCQNRFYKVFLRTLIERLSRTTEKLT